MAKIVNVNVIINLSIALTYWEKYIELINKILIICD